MCRLLHFSDDSYRLGKQTASFVRQAQALSRMREALAGRSEGDDVHRRQIAAVQFCDIAHMSHARQIAPGDRNGALLYLAGPQGLYSEK